MPRVVPILSVLEGENSDAPVDQLPRGSVRKVVNFIPRSQGGMARRRGGWKYASADLNAVSACSYLFAGVYAPFFSGPQYAMFADNLKMFKMADIGGTGGSLVDTLDGHAAQQVGKLLPIWHPSSGAPDGGYVVIPGGDSDVIGFQTRVRYWDGGGAFSTFAGSPPNGSHVASWGDYLLIGQSPDVAIQRIWFSAAGDPNTWDVSNSYVTIPEKIVAIVPRTGMIFVFGATGTHLITGDTPPPGGNLSLKKYVFSEGCSDIYATTTYKDYVIWANGSGVFKSDGSGITDLTELGGIKSHWPYAYPLGSGSPRLTLAVYRGFLFCFVSTGTTLIFDLERNSWWEWNNLTPYHAAKIPGVLGSYGDDVLLFDSTRPRAEKISSCFDPSNNLLDADGTNFVATLLTGAQRVGSLGYKRVRRAFFSFSFTGGGTLTANFATELNNQNADPVVAPALTSLGTLSTAGSQSVRAPLFLNRQAESVMLQVSMQGDARLSGIELELDQIEQTREGDSRA